MVLRICLTAEIVMTSGRKCHRSPINCKCMSPRDELMQNYVNASILLLFKRTNGGLFPDLRLRSISH